MNWLCVMVGIRRRCRRRVGRIGIHEKIKKDCIGVLREGVGIWRAFCWLFKALMMMVVE